MCIKPGARFSRCSVEEGQSIFSELCRAEHTPRAHGTRPPVKPHTRCCLLGSRGLSSLSAVPRPPVFSSDTPSSCPHPQEGPSLLDKPRGSAADRTPPRWRHLQRGHCHVPREQQRRHTGPRNQRGSRTEQQAGDSTQTFWRFREADWPPREASLYSQDGALERRRPGCGREPTGGPPGLGRWQVGHFWVPGHWSPRRRDSRGFLLCNCTRLERGPGQLPKHFLLGPDDGANNMLCVQSHAQELRRRPRPSRADPWVSKFPRTGH